MDTIFATSSGRPPAAIAIVRISGPGAFAAARRLAGELPQLRVASLRALRDAEGQLLDRSLVLLFPAPNSATGEDVVELHCHGGRAVVAAVERALGIIPGLRAAEAGEFTRRALGNGRIDLAEAEGLADLITAETEAQRVAAIDAAEGRVSRAVGEWSRRIADLSAEVEASLDWSDEGDVAGAATMSELTAKADVLRDEIEQAVAAAPVERLRDGIRVVLAGPPNAGKSTLFNALAERAASIVSPIAGTTRDVIEAAVTRRGTAYVLIDTAGIRAATADPIEREGIDRADAALKRADIAIWLGDEPPPADTRIWVHARADEPRQSWLPPGPTLAVSSVDAGSIERLWDAIEACAGELLPRAGALPLLARHRNLCARAASELAFAGADPLLLAEHLRLAHHVLAEITGARATDAMLDSLFARFCVGK